MYPEAILLGTQLVKALPDHLVLTRLLLMQHLLLFVIVCRMAQVVSGSLNLIPCSFSFLFIKTSLFVMCVCTPLVVLSLLRPRFSICLYYVLGNYRHARNHGGGQPAAGHPPLYTIIFRAFHGVEPHRGAVFCFRNHTMRFGAAFIF